MAAQPPFSEFTTASPPQNREEAPPSAETPSLPPSSNTNSLSRVAWAALILGIAYTVHAATGLILSVVVAVLLALLLAPMVKGLVSRHIPQAVAAAIVMLSLIGLVAALAINLYAPVQKWASFGPSDLRTIERKLKTFVKPVQSMQQSMQQVADKVAQITSPDENGNKREVVVERDPPFEMVAKAQENIFTVLTTLMLTYFLLASGDTFLRKAVRIVPRLRDKIRIVEIAREIQTEIGRYFLTITFLSTCLGAATSLAMWMLGMPTPLLWGVMAGLLNFVPYLGPIVALIVISIVSLFTFDQPTAILLPPAVFLGLHFIEGQIAEPLIMGDRFFINPVVIFIWMLIWGWLGGAIGVLIAVPLLVALRICASHIESMRFVTEIVGKG